MELTFEADLWRLRDGSWFFVTLPEDLSDDIADAAEGRTRGFGSVRVEVRIGRTTWRTSLFPSKELAAYVLPVKAAVRTTEGIDEGDRTTVHITLLDLGPAGSR